MPQPTLTRTNPNLVPNPDFSGGLAGWTTLFSPTPTYDASVSRTGGSSGSVKFPGKGGAIISGEFPLIPGELYTLSAYSRDDGTQPASYFLFLRGYTAGGSEVFASYSNVSFRSAANTWEENPNPVRVPTGTGITKGRITIHRFSDEPPGAGVLWVTNAYCGRGLSYGQAPAVRNAFSTGSHFRVDAEGNMTRWNGSAWEDFLILGIYVDGSRADWSVYSAKGFNVAYQTVFHSAIQKAYDVGMYSAFAMATYNVGFYCGPAPHWGLTRLNQQLADILSNGDLGKICTWYLDFELNETMEPLNIGFGVTDCPIRTTVATIKAWETANNGGPSCPFSILSAYVSLSRHFNAAGSQPESAFHMVSPYVVQSHDYEYSDIMNTQNLTMAPGPAILPNPSAAGKMRLSVYLSLMQGAKGYVYYADGDGSAGSFNDVTTAGWWSTVQDLNQEMTDLLPLIKTNAWTTWSVSTNRTEAEIYVRTRELSGVGYLFFVNRTSSSYSVTVTVSSLGYTITDVRDYFTNDFVATPSSNVFTFTLDGLNYTTGTKVVKLDGNVATTSPPVNDTTGSPFTVNIGTSTALTGVSVSDADQDLTTVTFDGGSNVSVRLGSLGSVPTGVSLDI